MLNQVILQGNMCKDAEDKLLNSGKAITTFTIASQKNYKNANGNYETNFIECVCFGKTAEFIHKYFPKGTSIVVVGELQTKTYEGNDGKKHKVYTVSVNSAYFCGSPKPKNDSPANDNENYNDNDPSDMPFEI